MKYNLFIIILVLLSAIVFTIYAGTTSSSNLTEARQLKDSATVLVNELKFKIHENDSIRDLLISNMFETQDLYMKAREVLDQNIEMQNYYYDLIGYIPKQSNWVVYDSLPPDNIIWFGSDGL